MRVISDVLKMVMEKKLMQANIECKETFEDYYTKYPDRSFQILVTEHDPLTNQTAREFLSFGFDKGKMVMKRIENPTLIMKVSLRVFKAILAGRITEDELFYEDYARFEGERVWKHKIILGEMIKAFKKVGFLKGMK